MGSIVSVINYKGGVGKTTITQQLGIGLAVLKQKRVLLVDLDPQCSLSLATIDEHYWADRVEKHGSVRDVIDSFYSDSGPHIDPDWIIRDALDRAWDSMEGETRGVDLLPSHLELPEYEMRLVARRPVRIDSAEEFSLRRNLILREAIAPFRDSYDYILFDCPPNIYMVSRNAILASDFYLVPTIPDFISCYGIPFILDHIERMQQEVRERGVAVEAEWLGIVRNRVRQAGGVLVREHEEQSRKLESMYGEKLLSTMVMDRIGVAELHSSRNNLYSGGGGEKLRDIRRDFTALVEECSERMVRPLAQAP